MSLYSKHSLMGGPEDFFAMEKTSAFKLSKEDTKWSAELHSWLKEEHPYLAQYSVNIVFKNTDSDRGYGVGSATVSKGFVSSRGKDGRPEMVPVGSSIHVPFVVRDYKPSPVKTFSDGKRYQVLNERNVAATMSGPSGAYKRVPKGEHDSPSGDSFFTPPDRAWEEYSGKRTTPVVKISSVMATPEERAHARKYGRWIKEAAVGERHVGSVVERTGTHFIVHDVFEKEGSLDYQRVQLTYPEAAQQGLSFRNGTFKSFLHRDSEVALTKESAISMGVPSRLTESGSCYVYDSGGQPLTGFLVTDVRELDGSNYPGSLLMTKQGFALGSDFYGGQLGILPEVNDVHTTGGLATFIHKQAATVPLYIDSWEEDIAGQSFTGRDMLGRSIVGRFGDVKNPVEITQGEYLFPKTASCLPLGNAVRVMREEDAKQVVNETICKEARIVYDGSTYYIPEHDYMDEGKARAYLAAYGASPTDTEVILKTAQVHGSAKFYPTPFEKTASIECSTERVLPWVNAEVLDTIIAGTKLIKEAGLADDQMTVDTILDLQFVTPENIRLFTDQMESYTDTISNLCQLSLGADLGANVDGDIAMRAADYLDRVVAQLNQQKPFTETA